MKYNRQQKYNFCSAVKSIFLVLLVCLSVLLCYSYLKTRQKNLSTLNSIELQKTQISDLEALSRANKELLKNLKSNIETQKLNLRKLLEKIGLSTKEIKAEKAFIDAKHVHKEMKDRYESFNNKISEMQLAENQKNEREKELRATKIDELRNDISKLRDVISNLKNGKLEASNIQSNEKVVVVSNTKINQTRSSEKLKDNRNDNKQSQEVARESDNLNRHGV